VEVRNENVSCCGQVEQERKIVSQSVEAASEGQSAVCKDHCSIRRADELRIHSSHPGLSLRCIGYRRAFSRPGRHRWRCSTGTAIVL